MSCPTIPILSLSLLVAMLCAVCAALGYLVGLRAGHRQGIELGHHMGLQDQLARLQGLHKRHPFYGRRANRDRAPAPSSTPEQTP